MDNDRISITQVLRALAGKDGTKEFSIAWITCNRAQRSGGQLKSLKRAVSLGAGQGSGNAPKGQARPSSPRPAKHFEHFTRNIRALDSKGKETGHIIKIHPELIILFNGKTVFLV